MIKQKKITKSKSPVKIREKQLANGNVSLYLDIYHNGKRWYEFLKLYLVQEVGANKAAAKQQNKNTWEVAEAIKAQRYRALLNGDAELKNNTNNKLLLLDWMQTYKEQQQNRGKENDRLITATIAIIEAYTGGKKVMLKDIDKAFCLGFINYVANEYVSSRTGKHLKAVSAKNYYVCFNAALNTAVRDEVISSNPFTKIASVDKIHTPNSTREFLTIDEVKQLINTPCKHQEVKQAFLFSCFCGLRISDVEALKWGNVMNNSGQYSINIVMKKTQEPIYLPLSAAALKWMPQQQNKKATDNVFDLPTARYINKVLVKWAAEAGVTKHISFHVSRHTFATLNLTSGVDLYTTSKLLGHKEITTTEIYAKIINQKKDEAVNAVSSLFD